MSDNTVVDNIERLIMDVKDNLERLIMDVKESLERETGGLGNEIGSLRQEMREGFAQINTRFDTQAARLDRHADL